jgi:recombination protein RecA
MGKKRATKLEMAVAYIHRRFGPRSLTRGSRIGGKTPSVPHISTGFLALDRALGIGGLPRGRVSEILGLPTSGKTTLAIKFLAQAQAAGGQVVYIDQARYFDPDYAHRCGLDLSRLLVGTPYDVGEALGMTEALVRNGGVSALIFDLLEIFWTDARAARGLTATLNRLSPFLARSGTALLFLRDASTESSPALSALAHYATVRLQVIHEGWLRHHGEIRGYEARVEVLKNRFGPADRVVNLQIAFNGTVRGNGL